MDYVLYHHGIKGQKWGVRRYRNTDGSLISVGKKRYTNGNPEKRKQTVKNIAKAAAAVGTVAACAYLYTKNKDRIDSFVKKSAETAKNTARSQKTARSAKEAAYVAANRDKILKSPAKLAKYMKKGYFEDNAEVAKAVARFKLEDAVHNANLNRMQRGAKYVGAVLAYTAAATTAYNLKNSPIVKDTQNKKKKTSN